MADQVVGHTFLPFQHFYKKTARKKIAINLKLFSPGRLPAIPYTAKMLPTGILSIKLKPRGEISTPSGYHVAVRQMKCRGVVTPPFRQAHTVQCTSFFG